MWKLVALVCVLIPSSVAAAKGGWGPGLTLKVHASIETRLLEGGPTARRAVAEVRYRVRTVKDGAGFRVSIEDAVLVSADGDPDLKRRILRDAAFFRSNPTFRVRKSGDFDGSIDGDATLESLRSAFAHEPALAMDNPTVLQRDVLDRWLTELWEAWHPMPSPADSFGLALADGFIAKATLSEDRIVAATCPGSRMKCTRRIRVVRIESEETRQHLETSIRASGSPNASLRSYVEEIRSDAFADGDGLPLSIERTEEKRMDLAVGSRHRETVAVSTSRMTFTQ